MAAVTRVQQPQPTVGWFLEKVSPAMTAQLQLCVAGQFAGETDVATAAWFSLPGPARELPSPANLPVHLVFRFTHPPTRHGLFHQMEDVCLLQGTGGTSTNGTRSRMSKAWREDEK